MSGDEKYDGEISIGSLDCPHRSRLSEPAGSFLPEKYLQPLRYTDPVSKRRRAHLVNLVR
jgi:hypothetical protein